MRRNKHNGKGRVRALLVLCAVVFALFLVRLAWMQFAMAGYYDEKVAEASTTRYSYTVPAARGDILDRNGQVLAQDTPVWDVYLKYPAPSGSSIEAAARQTLDILQLSGGEDVETQLAAFCSSVSAGEYLLASGVSAADTALLYQAGLVESGALRLSPAGARTWPDGTLLPAVEADMKEGPHNTQNAMATLTKFLYWRYQAGGYPLAACSFDNCSHNGQTLHNSVAEIAEAWCRNGQVEQGFVDWLNDESKVSFPWSMIDKIVPRPSKVVEESLTADGIEGMEAIVTKKGGYTAAFVNAERPQYLVIEDKFPNGRPPLDKVGVIFCDRETVNKTERMKVTTCLNPLHTAMSVNGCMLGYTKIADEMKDPDIVALVKRLGYVEGLPVVTDPGIVSPKAFLDEVVEQRLPNVFMPDDPRRIATDTSQKVGVRFGETIKSYVASGRDFDTLVSIPLALAGWMRYLLAVNDAGEEMEVSDDPLKETLQAQLKGIVWNDPASYSGQLRPILSNASIFGVDLTTTPLADKIEKIFVEELAGPGSVRATLQKYLANA